MSRILLQQALDALKYHTAHTYPFHLTNIAIEALKQELAKPEPQLTDAGADTNISRGLEPKGSGMVTLNQVGMRVDLKDAPPRKPWVGLTSEELAQLTIDNIGYPTRLTAAIEAKLKEKNT